jgi:hypothetical protein
MTSGPGYTTSTRAPVAASAIFVVLFGAMLLLCVAGLLGLTPLRPPLVFTAVCTAVFFVLTTLFVVLLVHNVGNRLTVDGRGVRAARRTASIDLPWSEIATVQVVLLVTRPVVPELLVPTPLDRNTRARLELRLHDPERLEAAQPLLERARIRDERPGGATHQFALPSGRMISTATPADYSPELQALLPDVAGERALPTEVRSAWTLLH